MESGWIRHWPVWIVVAATGLSLFVLSLIMKPTKAGLFSSGDQSYEMLRPNSLRAQYDLSGRQVIRNIHSVEGATAPVNAKTVTVTPQIQDEKALKASREAEAKYKAQNAANKKKMEAEARKTAQKKAEARRKAELAIRMNNEANQNRLRALETSKSQSPSGVASAGNLQTLSDSANGFNSEPVESELKVTAAQWRDLLKTQPNEKNASDFVASFQAGEIDARDFYMISRELLSDSMESRHRIGLVILKQQPSAESFMILVAQYKDVSQVEIYEALKEYGQASKLMYLKQVMATSDSRSVTMATQILTKVVDAQQTQQNSSAGSALIGREIRSPGAATQISSTQLLSFLPVLEHLATQSKNPDLANQAQALKTKIEGLKAA